MKIRKHKILAASKLNYNTPELKKLRKAIQSIVVDSDDEFVQLVDDMINNVTMNYVPETRALKRCIDNMLEYDSESEVRTWVLKYAADLGCIASMEDSVISSTAVKGGNNMKKYVQAAESDYIKIGNMMIPKNAASYGYDSYENIARDAKQRLDTERETKRKADEAAAKAAKANDIKAKGAALYQECKEAISDASSDKDKVNALFDILVPDSGKSDTLAGEIIRAVTRIGYRWYNDGDYFYTGYGLETCGPDAAFLADIIGGDTFDLIVDATDNMGDEQRYDLFIEDLTHDVLDYVMGNPDIFGVESTYDSRNYTSNTLDEIKENSKNMEFELDVYGLAEFVDRDIISWSDVEYWLQELTSYYGGTVNAWARDGFTIVDIDMDQYDEWENMYEKELDSYMSELESELENDENYDEDEE